MTDIMLIPDLYRIDRVSKESDGTLFDISILPDCEVYKGHFPGKPVTPGVCTLQIIKECAGTITCKPLAYSEIKLCRYSKLISPQGLPHARLKVNLEQDGESQWRLAASLSDADSNEYVTLKAVMNG